MRRWAQPPGRRPPRPCSLAGTTVPVGDSTAKAIPVGTTDTGRSSVLHVPGLSPAELIDRMMAAYPDVANPYTLWVAAYDLLGASG
jgi:hypothetical protein